MSSPDHLSELESMRLQVADLTRALAERDGHLDRGLQNQPEQPNLLRAIVAGTASDTGEEFFRSLVRHLAQALNVRYAFLGEWCEQASARVRTLAVWSGTDFAEPFEYDLLDTPCANVVGQRLCLHKSGVQQLFPKDHLLAQMSVESYCGVPLFDKSGKPLGLLVVMDDRPMTFMPLVKDLLQIFATRAGAELRHQKSEEALRESERSLRFTQFAVDHASDGILWVDDSNRFVYANEAACRLLGYSNEELLTLSISDIAPYQDPTRFQQRLDQIKQRTVATYESIHRRKDGTEFPVEASVTYLEHEGKGYTCGIVRDITERKRIEQERAQAMADLHNVMESIPDVVFALNTQGNLVKWNRRLKDVTGYSPEELLNKPALAFVPPEEQARIAAAIQRAFTEGYAELDGYLLTKEQRLIPYHWTGALLKDTHGEPIGITGIGRDVSDRNQAEEALRRSEERLALAVEGSNDILWDAHRLPGEPWYAPQTPIWWSPRVREWLGLEESESFETLEQWVARLHPDDKDRVFGQLAAHIEQRVPYDIEYRLRTNRGDYSWLRGRGQALWDEQGEPRRMSGSCQDITERKQVEEALRKSEAQFRALAESTTDWMWEIDEQGRFTYCSPKIQDILGYEPNHVLGKTPFDFMPEEEARRVAGLFGPIAAARKPFAGIENTNRHKDGRLVILECRGTPVIDDNGLFRGYRGFDHDITDRKHAEEERQKQEVLIALMLNTGPACIKRVAADGSLLHMNPTGLKLVEACGEPEVVGRSVFNLITPEHRDAFISMHRRVIEGHACTLQFEIQGLKGTRRWVESDAVPFRNPATGQMEQLAVTHDITERKQAEEALRESETFNISVLNSLSSQIVVLNSQGVIMAVNKPWLRFAVENGASHLVENFVGMNYLNVCAQASLFAHGEEAASAQAGILAVLAGTQNEFSLEYPCHSTDQQRWFRMRVTPLLDSQAGVVVAHENITERKLAEGELRASEERLRLSLEAANQGIYDLNVQTGEAIVSSGYVTMLDYDSATFRETHAAWIERLHPEDRDRVTEYYRAYVAGTIPEYRVEFRQRTRGGGWRWVLSLGRIVERDAMGEPLRMLGTHTDITERKRVEEALRESEERFNLAVRGSNTGIWDWDLRTDKTYFSPLWKSMLGYEEHELQGEFFEWDERLHPDDRERSLATVRAYLEGATPQYELEHRLRHKDGSYRWILARGVSICDTEGKLYRMAGSHIDITEQRQTQEALAQSERQLRTVLDALPVGVWFTDRAGKPLLANPVAKQIWSNIKQIGLQNPNSSEDWRETVELATGPHRWALSHALTTGVSSLNETLDLESFDGTKKTIRNSTVPVQDETGTVLGAIVLNEDVTMLKQAQKALKLTQFSVDHAVEGFFWINQDARVVHVNEAACRMLEYTRDELTTMTVHDIDPNFLSEAWPVLWDRLKENGSLTFETKYWSRTGRVLDTEVTVNYLQYEESEYCIAIMRDIGERKRAQAALRASEERYRSLYDNTPTMYFTLATDGTVLSVNRFGAEQLGYQVEELTGHSVLGLFHEDDKETVAASLSECLATPEPTRRWEFRKVRKDGSVIWVRETVHVGQSSSGETIILVTCEDMTERKRADEKIAQLVERLELATTAGQIGVWDWRISSGEMVWDDRMFALYGVKKEDFGGAYGAWLATVDPVDQARCNEAVQQALRKEKPYDIEFCIRWPNGTVRVIKADGQVVWDKDGVPLRMTGVNYDITERKQAEERLHQSHSFLRQVIDVDPNFIFAKDREGRFTLVNKAVADAYGTTVDDLIGKTDADFNPNQEEVAFFRQKDLAVMDTLHELFLPEEVITDSGGRTHWLQTVKRPILNNEGRAIMVLGASTDITERKRVEETLRQRERDLRAAIEERERISQDLHDGILQSLFAVGLSLETAKSMMPARARKTAAQPLNQAIQQLNLIMREIRNFIAGLGSDLLQGKDLTMALKQMLASLTESQDMRVRLAIEDRAAKALSTEQSLHMIRVIQEAVSNCIQHGRASEARVSLKLLKQGVRLSVRDNGCGFNQAGAKRAGHGLRNMASRAKKIGGKFSVLSKVKEGTRIVFDVPRETADVSR